MRRRPQPPAEIRYVQTIQATSKRFKGPMALGVLAILVGIVWMIFASVAGEPTETPRFLIGGGFFTYFLARFCAWWENG